MKAKITATTVVIIAFIAGFLISNLNHQQHPAVQMPLTFSLPADSNNSSTEFRQTKPKFSLLQLREQQTIFSLLQLSYLMAGEMEEQEIRAMLFEAASSEVGVIRENVVSVLIRKYSDLAPEAAIQFVQQTWNLPDDRYVPLIVSNWFYRDSDAASEYVMGLDEGALKTRLASRLVSNSSIANIEVAQAMEALLGSSEEQLIFEKQANSLPPSVAFQNALNLSNESLKTRALINAAYRWAKIDPVAAADAIRIIGDENLRSQLMVTIYRNFAKADREAALRYLIESPPNNDDRHQQMLLSVANADPEASVTLVREFAARIGTQRAVINWLNNWGQKQPKNVIAFLEGHATDVERKQFFGNEYNLRTRIDPEDAMDWLLDQTDRYPQEVSTSLKFGVNKRSLNSAKAALSKATDRQIRSDLVSGIAAHLFRTSPTDAQEWLSQYAGQPEYADAILSNATYLPRKNLDLTMALLEPVLNDERSALQTQKFASTMSLNSPTRAIEWIESMPKGEAKSGAILGTLSFTSYEQPQAAAKLLDLMSDGYRKEEAKVLVAGGMIYEGKLTLDQIVEQLELSGYTEEKVRATAYDYGYRP